MFTDKTASRSSALRTERYRARRRQGTRCVTVDVNESEIAALVVKGYLAEGGRRDATAIKAAVEMVLSDMAFELLQETTAESGS
jgi:hypothetical protein